METTIFWALLEIMIIFLVLTFFLKELIKKKFKLKICAICSAVSFTWITLLSLKFAGVLVDDLLMGILMGGSVVGVMYLFEKKIKEAGKNRLLWLKIFIVILGIALTYLLLSEIYNWTFWLSLLAGIGLFVYSIASLSSREGSGEGSGMEDEKNRFGKYSEEIKKIEEKLEHCCD